MGKLFDGLTWDNMCSYSTPKVAEIQDRRLGFVYYFLIFLVAVYTLGYVVVWEKRYLLLEAPSGSVRLSLLSPQNNPNSGDVPPPADTLPYCLQAQPSYGVPDKSNPRANFTNYECLYFDEDFAVYPTLEETAMLVATRIRNETQTLDNCTLSDHTCTYIEDPGIKYNTFFIANIENFTLLIDHSIYAGEVNIQANSVNLPGELLNAKGKKMKNLQPPNQVGVKGKSDIMSLGLVLEAAGIPSLDSPSSADPNVSKRYDGIVLLFFIDYSNTYTYSTHKIHYQYRIAPIDGAKFKTVQPIYTKNISNRLLWNRHGIRMLFIQTGLLGEFDFQTLLISFVTGLSLVGVAGLVIDYALIRYFSPIKKLYRNEKFIATEEWAELKQHPYENIQVDTEDHYQFN